MEDTPPTTNEKVIVDFERYRRLCMAITQEDALILTSDWKGLYDILREVLRCCIEDVRLSKRDRKHLELLSKAITRQGPQPPARGEERTSATLIDHATQ